MYGSALQTKSKTIATNNSSGRDPIGQIVIDTNEND